jgi:hypothetical protein
MGWFVLIREAGPAWTDGGIAAQPALAEHAAFMSALADERASSSAADRSPGLRSDAFAPS